MTVAEATGLLIRGQHYEVPGVTILGPGDAPWVKLSAEDYRKRAPGDWLRQLFVHSTKGIWPQPIIPGTDPDAWARIRGTADYWSGNHESGGAAIVVDGMYAVCLCDLALDEAFHATTSNRWSIGIEMYQRPDGGIYEATLGTTVTLVKWLCDHFGIPFQIPSSYRDDHIIERMRDGGPDCVGVFGHRDQAWKFAWQLEPAARAKYPDGYANRGRGDPGDEFYRRCAIAGARQLDYECREDLALGRQLQQRLNELGEHLAVDGIAGPATMAAWRRHAASMPR